MFQKVANGGILRLGSNGNIRFNETSKTMEVSIDGGNTWMKIGSGRSRMVLPAEYSGAVLSGDGTNNIGNMVTDNTGINSNSMNYYEWNSSESTLNDYDIRVRIILPSNFESWGGGGITVYYSTESTSVLSNKVGLYIFEQRRSIIDAQQEDLVSRAIVTGKQIGRAHV